MYYNIYNYVLQYSMTFERLYFSTYYTQSSMI
uniref:Uncharacterized protein n=1 Tax=Myoviridae sp. ct2cn10 TaxID=2825022 RepID=A0A8S5PC37_9CAUD|nr:MAG TPA: hypothetical protein [Myoviridae sp. ct2cn10]